MNLNNSDIRKQEYDKIFSQYILPRIAEPEQIRINKKNELINPELTCIYWIFLVHILCTTFVIFGIFCIFLSKNKFLNFSKSVKNSKKIARKNQKMILWKANTIILSDGSKRNLLKKLCFLTQKEQRNYYKFNLELYIKIDLYNPV